MSKPTNELFLADKVILITGSSGGLGATAAEMFAGHGSKLVLHGRNEEGLQRTIQRCVDAGLPRHKVISVTGELTKEDDCRKLADAARNTFGCIDVLVNNVGIVKSGGFQQCTLEDFDECFNVNMRSMFVMSRVVVPWLMASKGCIVNVSSFTAIRPVNDYFAYCLSKTAVDQFTRSLALELGPMGIRVNSVNPGIMRDTNLWIRPGMVLAKHPLYGGLIMKKVGTMYPIGRASVSAEVAPAILFLASEKTGSFITGVNLLVDGGKALTSQVCL